MAGIFFELTNPGAIFPGVVGAISIVTALFALHTLPVNYAGLILIFMSICLFVFELFVVSHGILALGGCLALLIGSLMLFDSPIPALEISPLVIAVGMAAFIIFFLVIIGLTIRTHRKKPASGPESMIGKVGVTQTELAPEGKIFVYGELWNAYSDKPVSEGAKVKIVGAKGMQMKVREIERETT